MDKPPPTHTHIIILLRQLKSQARNKFFGGPDAQSCPKEQQWSRCRSAIAVGWDNSCTGPSPRHLVSINHLHIQMWKHKVRDEQFWNFLWCHTGSLLAEATDKNSFLKRGTDFNWRQFISALQPHRPRQVFCLIQQILKTEWMRTDRV